MQAQGFIDTTGLIDAIGACFQQEGLYESHIPGLKMYRCDSDIPRQPAIYHPSLCVVAQGDKQIWFGDYSHTYDAEHYLLNSMTFPIEAAVMNASADTPYLGLILEIDATIVSQLMAKMEQYIHYEKVEKGQEVVTSTRISPLMIQQLVRLVELDSNAMDRDILADGIKREIFYEVLKGPYGCLLRNCVDQHSGAHRIAPVVHFIEQNYQQALDIDTIAEVANMSPSTLYEHFKAVTSLSPVQFIKNLRLHRARNLLMSGEKASDACYSVGYSSPSQFSREFKRLFGCSPREIRSY